MTCTSCGKPLEAGAVQCPACGTAVGTNGMPATSVSQRLRPLTEEKTINPVRTSDVLVNRYRLVDKVGEGGMGAVFVAHDQELDRQVAVKLLAAALVNDPEVNERFEREARLTARLDHPNIVPIYDVGRHEGRPFIVMKLLSGDSLAGLLRQKGGLTADETLKLMRQLASGLDYIHKQGFIHRDIKAGNIFVSPDGHATILDFGILRQKSATTGITRTGMVMGTPHYMAPEQALGLKDVDHRVDLYALGVVLFECLTGTLPFEADSELRLIQLQAHAPPPEILERAPWIPPPVAQVVRKALAKKPDDRFSSAAELVAALDAAYAQAKSAVHAAPTPIANAPAVPTNTAPSLRKLADEPKVAVVATPSTAELQQVVKPRTPVFAIVSVVAVVGAAAAWFASGQGADVKPLPRVVDAGLAQQPELDAGAALAVADLPDAGPDEAVADAGADEDAGVALAQVEDAGAPEPDEPIDAGAIVKKGNPTSIKKKGQMNVLSTHGGEPYWAQVTIDGVPRGRTPLLLDLPVGKYSVRVERTGFKPALREVRVAGGKSTVVKVELVQP